jgi:hypothetical protein
MDPKTKEIQRRTQAALLAIKEAMNEGDNDSMVELFVSHHLRELNAEYWNKYAGIPRPSATEVLDLLELRSHWGEEDEEGIDIFDFSLPGDVTQYVISVRFDEDGEVEGIEMES